MESDGGSMGGVRSSWEAAGRVVDVERGAHQ
jgi:hypothetical protein